MLNKIMLIGNLGRDPEMTYTPSGAAVTKFSVAVTRRQTDKTSGERKDDTTWFSVVAWNRLGETCNTYLRKGSKVYLEGRMTSRKYTSKDGHEVTAWEVVADQMEMLGERTNGNGNGNGGSSDAPAADDGIPF